MNTSCARLEVAASRPAPVAREDTIEVVVTRLAVGPGAVRASAALLSDAERQRARRFACDRDARRFIVSRARLRRLLAERLDMRPESVELVYGAHGKPALARSGVDSDLRFNVSHHDDVAVYAFASGREIGIDVEAIRMIPDAGAIAARWFSRRENAAYQALAARDRPLGFVNCWTRKEAFVKALGDGLSYPLDRFDVSLAPHERATILRVENTPGDRCGWRLVGFSPAPGFVAAVVAQCRGSRAAAVRLRRVPGSSAPSCRSNPAERGRLCLPCRGIMATFSATLPWRSSSATISPSSGSSLPASMARASPSRASRI